MQSVVWNEALKINGADPDFHRRDMCGCHRRGRLPAVGTWAFRSLTTNSPIALSSTSSTPQSSSPKSRCRYASSAR
ncbi:hypothetical protein [Sulfitobacter sp. W002]|uniref:hypothetical protein n=1 Tax=Sulfitobacter sp. W002 TaxID=2867024 RepID=UPI0038FC89E4